MTGNIWMCSHLLDTEDLEFGMHEFITYKIPDDEDDIDDAEEEGGDVSSICGIYSTRYYIDKIIIVPKT